jgi:hypothetical protein
MLVLLVVTPCGLVSRYQCFGGIYCLHLQGWSAEDKSNMFLRSVGICLKVHATWVLRYRSQKSTSLPPREPQISSIHPMALQPESGPGLLTYWRFLHLFYAFRVAGGKPAASAQFLLNPDSSARGQSHLGVKQERDGWETWPLNFAYKESFHACKVLLHAVNLRHGTNGFTSPPKDFITLKNHCPRPVLNPRSTLTTRPPRATLKTHNLIF